jgi:hypothetical protein
MPINYEKVREKSRLVRLMWKHETGPKHAERIEAERQLVELERSMNQEERDAYLKGQYYPE